MFLMFAGFGTFFCLAERLFAVRRQAVLRREFFTDLFYIPIQYFMRTIVNGTIAVGLAELGQRYLPAHSINLLRGRPLWVQTVTLIFIIDFIFYVMHRLKHQWQWWWRLHQTHHSSKDLDFLSAVRFHPLEKLLDRITYLLPLLVLGVSNQAIFVWAAVDSFMGMFSHSNLKWRIGPLKYVFVGPEMHRWHHVRHPGVRECNYGNHLSIFDWIFGTAYVSKEEPAEFGVDDPEYPEGDVVRQFLHAFRRGRSKAQIQTEEAKSF
jgi:sterol desaturase/sphingolipid hydroxylase (fatty acid hydroxylase superfamily)